MQVKAQGFPYGLMVYWEKVESAAQYAITLSFFDNGQEVF